MALAGLALHLALVRLRARGILAHDTYAYFSPQWIWVREALTRGGRGLLWMPLQNCGQPFLANPQVGLLYPPHWLLPLLGLDTGLVAVSVVNQLIGGLGMLWLGRELGLGLAASTIGALAFSLGNTTVDMAGWSPMHHGPWVWFPAALAATEQLVRLPGPRSVVMLAAVMALAVLPGYPIIGFFIGLVVGFRVLWAVAGRERARAPQIVAAALAAALLCVGLAAAQLVPSTEFAADSLRLDSLGESDRAGSLSWEGLRKGFWWRSANQPFSILLLVLAAPALAHPDRRKRWTAVFHLLVILVFLGVSFGQGSPLYEVFARLPVGRSFRLPTRALWPAGFALAVLVALGVDAIASAAHARGRAGRLALVALPVLTVVALVWAVGSPTFWRADRIALVLVLGAAGLAVWLPAAGTLSSRMQGTGAAIALLALFAAVVVDRMVVPPLSMRQMMPSVDSLYQERALFETVRPLLGADGRAYLVTQHPMATRFAMMDKTATVLGVPAVWDYEAMVSRRYGAFFVRLALSGRATNLSQVIFAGSYASAKRLNRPLLDLVAARVLIQARDRQNSFGTLASVVPVQSVESADVLLNARARPRAFFVPRVEVVPDPEVILDRLAGGREDPGRVAFVEAAPASGFLGSEESGGGGPTRVTFVRNDPESIALRVTAPQRGFVFLSDQMYPGWEATVDGVAAPILRANVAFRLVEVPAGSSLVEMRYRPRSVLLGFGVTGASLLLSAALLWRDRRRPWT